MGIFWSEIQRLGISDWFELVLEDPNPSDDPTRRAFLPSPFRGESNFGVREELMIWINSEVGLTEQFTEQRNPKKLGGRYCEPPK